MSDGKQETVADIVADMRRIGLPRYDYTAGDMEADRRRYAKRIEAAHEREVKQARESAWAGADEIHDIHCRDCVLRSGDMVALREALKRIRETAKAWANPGADAAVTLGHIIDIADIALVRVKGGAK